MRIAVITPCHNAPFEQLAKCHESVMRQTVDCTQIFVDDGSEPSREGVDALMTKEGTQVIHLPHRHADTGNAARAVGAVSAVCQEFEAITFLDADNWYESEHLETLVDLHKATDAAVCSSSRNLYTPEGVLLGKCPEVDGKRFVDTNCMFLTSRAFKTIAFWYMMPPRMKLRGDRFVWKEIVRAGLKCAHTDLPTVAYRTLHRFHYEHFGLIPPANAKEFCLEGGQYIMKTTGSGS